MADEKYGRIFTDTDLRNVVQRAMEQDIQSEDELDQIIARMDGEGSFKFPADEPVFVLRAQDMAAASGLYGYQEGVENFDDGSVPQEHKDGIDKAIKSFSKFALANKTKLPD